MASRRNPSQSPERARLPEGSFKPGAILQALPSLGLREGTKGPLGAHHFTRAHDGVLWGFKGQRSELHTSPRDWCRWCKWFGRERENVCNGHLINFASDIVEAWSDVQWDDIPARVHPLWPPSWEYPRQEGVKGQGWDNHARPWSLSSKPQCQYFCNIMAVSINFYRILRVRDRWYLCRMAQKTKFLLTNIRLANLYHINMSHKCAPQISSLFLSHY